MGRRRKDRMDAPRVVIADDDVLLREGLASLLQREGFEVVRAGRRRRGAAGRLVHDRRPQLVLTDIRMPPGHSTEGWTPRR